MSRFVRQAAIEGLFIEIASGEKPEMRPCRSEGEGDERREMKEEKGDGEKKGERHGLLPKRNAGQPLSGDETVSQRMSGHIACPLVHMMHLFAFSLFGLFLHHLACGHSLERNMQSLIDKVTLHSDCSFICDAF